MPRLTFKILGFSALIALPLLSLPCDAQRSLPFGDDALVLGFGQMRATIRSEWQFYDQLYSASGSQSLVPFGASLAFPTIGPTEFPELAAYQAAIRGVSGQPSFQFSLGTSDAHASHRTGSTALHLDLGLPGRLMISAEVPWVRVETTAGLTVNTQVNGANVGVNPALTNKSAFSADTSLAGQISRARNTLNSRLANCPGSTSSQCTEVNARRSDAQSLVTTATSVANGLLRLSGGAYVPLSSSPTQAAITAQIAAITSSFRDFGITTITGTTLAPAAVPITAAQFRQLLESSSLGSSASVPAFKALTRVGDINVGAKFKVIDTRAIRAAAFARVFFPTGGKPSPSELLPLDPGAGTTRTEVGGVADIFVASRLSVTAAGAVATWLAGNANARIVMVPGLDFLLTENTAVGTAIVAQRARRTGVNLSFAPRYSINRWMTIGGQYQRRTLGAEQFSSADAGEIIVWNQHPASTENRVGAGISFSNTAEKTDNSPRFPVEASFSHAQSVSGSGLQPKLFSDEIRFRIFLRR